MEALSKKHDAGVIFNDFLDYYITSHSSSDTFNKNNYTQEEQKQFNEALQEFQEGMKTLIQKHGYYDYLGEFYEEFVVNTKKSKNKGQFFTPPEISELLTRLTQTKKQGDESTKTAYDCGCGSGRNLLNTYYHTHCNIVGEDIDNMACRMAVVNFHVNGVHKAQVNHVDTLTREDMGSSWLVLDNKIYVTNQDELAVMEAITGFTKLCMLDLNLSK